MRKELSDTELETYGRQIALDEIDYDGQLSLRNGKACLIGLGGLGTPIALKLVGMGIGHLRIVDRDIVSRSDLHRQYLYDVDSVGKPKVEVALQKLSRLNPDVKIEPFAESFNSANADEIIGGVDVVLDGLDRPEPRYIVNRTCNRLKIPYVFAGAIGTSGNVTTIVPGKTICLECFMPGLKDDDVPKCAVVGVHPSALGVITAIQVFEAVRVLTGKEPTLLNQLLYIDLPDMKFHHIRIEKSENCPICGDKPKGSPAPLRNKFVEETCARDGRSNFIISPKEKVEVDLEAIRKILSERGYRIKASGAFGITFEQSEEITASILKSGIMIIQTSPYLKGSPRDRAFGIFKSILIDDLGLSPAVLPEA
ncbi:MAG: HesA/MoeB/ThiF family protein [Desulfobacteraceae bacterium]|nr:HesA/MoeB/ThiF family protein [Desulfobacteraceae bacterium]